MRRNGDEELRALEREAAAGGAEEKLAWAEARRAAGLPVDPWELEPVAYVFLEAMDLGERGRVEAVTKDGRVERFYVVPGGYPSTLAFKDTYDAWRWAGFTPGPGSSASAAVAANAKVHLRSIREAKARGFIVLDRYLTDGHDASHEGTTCFCQAQRFHVLERSGRPWLGRFPLPRPHGALDPSEYSSARIMDQRGRKWRNPGNDEMLRELERRARSGDIDAARERHQLAAEAGETLVGRVDGWNYTRGGIQVTTIDGVKYATVFDLAKLGLRARDLVEWRPSLRDEPGWALKSADILRVVGHDDEEERRLVEARRREVERIDARLMRALSLANARRRNRISMRDLAELVRDAMRRPRSFGESLTSQKLVGGTLFEVVAVDERRAGEFRDRDEGDPVLTVAVRSTTWDAAAKRRARLNRGDAIFDPLHLDMYRFSQDPPYAWDWSKGSPPADWEPADRVRARQSLVREWVAGILEPTGRT